MASKYNKWMSELKVDGIDVDRMDIQRDVPKFEMMNGIKVNVHVWEKGLKGIRYNSRRNTASKTVNLLLVVNKDGDQHYCGIPQLSRLYHHKTTVTQKVIHVNAAPKHSIQKRNTQHTMSGAAGDWRGWRRCRRSVSLGMKIFGWS